MVIDIVLIINSVTIFILCKCMNVCTRVGTGVGTDGTDRCGSHDHATLRHTRQETFHCLFIAVDKIISIIYIVEIE